ncbi:uncharacterized protein LOC121398213 isoform X2 [Xenopus laevis]|uniref:Uncharacterized protein LOC121398213 isoform X2 n=1 Tax=Xenopus laevis TaxID=8355 RepID=A0A8J1LTZ2_XENLA|nr:uncharacterized protein LOC121398213 isoform X2 [Xenopus laevis]
MLLISVSLCYLVSLAAGTCLKGNGPGGIRQHPRQILIKPGGTVNISCTAEHTKNVEGVHLLKRFDKIVYVNSDNKFHNYVKNIRINVFGNVSVYNFTVTISNVTESDTGFYLCDGMEEDDNDICGEGTVLIVTANTFCDNSRNASDSSANHLISLVVVIVMLSLFLIPILIFAIYRIYELQMKNPRQPLNSVYEDMRQTLRRNTMNNT